MKDCVEAGLIYDMTDLVKDSAILKPFEAGALGLSDYFGTDVDIELILNYLCKPSALKALVICIFCKYVNRQRIRVS